MFLIELAQRRLTLDRDVETAIVALESADARLASLRDPGVAPVRQQIARKLQALRAVRQPDTTGILARLASAEEQAARLPVKGILATERRTTDRIDAARRHVRARLGHGAQHAGESDRRAQGRRPGGSIVTAEEAQVRRQHLQLLLFSARAAVERHDDDRYRTALAGARQWLGDFFDLSSPARAGAAGGDPVARAHRHRSAAAGYLRLGASAATAAARARGPE